ncbi:helix-turn-helix domain-containing protein [Candidatus Thiothrix anitrata]|jgi:transcriptional regulator with XRE-family HTH domain|uniref:Helix-turn-helix transcriptional regulator n=1 Tax=Candidatus Thiothrix anitrata TaxID=2823902 RepID=A0ABX7X021_9GAMM|nr:helix-turn-helix transcriptional regulator [Candidatus Thiothrix anitrata]QTR49011.1 helix-turn-helix transcriptional regulator [Candidatus Thiothrix anitrata]
MSAEALSLFLRKQMRHRGLSNTQVAQLAGISRQTWYNILNSEIKETKISTLIRVAEVLEVRPLQLLDVYFDGRVSNLAA